MNRTTEPWRPCFCRAQQEMSDYLTLFWEQTPPCPAVSPKHREHGESYTHTCSHTYMQTHRCVETHIHVGVMKSHELRTPATIPSAPGSKDETGPRGRCCQTQHSLHTSSANKHDCFFCSGFFFYGSDPRFHKIGLKGKDPKGSNLTGCDLFIRNSEVPELLGHEC